MTKKSLKTTLSQEQLDKLETLWQNGIPANELAIKFGVSTKDVNKHIKTELVDKYRSRYEKMAQVFEDLYKAAHIANKAYIKDPRTGNSMAYTAIVNSLRGAMVDLDGVQSNKELAADILSLAINPLIRKLTQAIIDEFGVVKNTLSLKFSEEDAANLINDTVKRISTHFSSAVNESAERLEQILGVQDKNKAKILNLKKKHSHLRSVPNAG